MRKRLFSSAGNLNQGAYTKKCEEICWAIISKVKQVYLRILTNTRLSLSLSLSWNIYNTTQVCGLMIEMFEVFVPIPKEE